MRWLLDNVFLNPLVLLSIGSIFAFVGGAVIYDLPGERRHLSYVERLPPVTAATPGRAAFVEGRIGAQNPTVYRQFVAYVYEKYGRRKWAVVAGATPPLVIEANGRLARVINNNYRLQTTAVTVREAEPTVTEGAIQSRGYVVGSPVMAVGSVAEADGLVAEFLYAGTHAEYIERQRSSLQRGLWWASGFLLFGTGCVLLGVWQLYKSIRETRATEKARAAQALQREQHAKLRSPKKKRR